MKLSRLWGAFPWRMALLLALVPGIPLLIFGAWFRWELPPLQRYYLRAYWGSSEGTKQPGSETQIQWLFKAAPGRKRQPVIGDDVSSGGVGILSIRLSPSALKQGWTSLEKSPPEAIRSTELEGFLKEDFYGNQSFHELIAEPLLYGCVLWLVLIFPAFMMQEELRAEWKRLCEAISVGESAFDSAWDLPPYRPGIAERIQGQIALWNRVKKLRLRRSNSPALTSHYSRANPAPIAGRIDYENKALSATVRQGNSGTPEAGNSPSSRPPKKPSQGHSIFPGAASVRATNAEPKLWDESQWID